MPVKGNKSGSRLLAILECIARHQPVGVSRLSRLLDTDKSTVQRGIITLLEAGWVYASAGEPTRWQLTGHINLVAYIASRSNGLRQRARPALEALRDATGETVCLAVPDIGGFVLIEVIESRQPLRMVPHEGIVISAGDTASGRAVLPYLPREEQLKVLGGLPDAALEKSFEVTRRQGYAVSDDDRAGGSTSVAAPIFDVGGRPIGAVVLCAPQRRLRAEHYAQVGAMVLQTTHGLSSSPPPGDPQALSQTVLNRAQPSA